MNLAPVIMYGINNYEKLKHNEKSSRFYLNRINDRCSDYRYFGSSSYTLANCDTYAKIGAVKAGAEAGAEVASVIITSPTAVITGTGSDADASTYILTPTAANNSLNWVQTGTCIANGVC